MQVPLNSEVQIILKILYITNQLHDNEYSLSISPFHMMAAWCVSDRFCHNSNEISVVDIKTPAKYLLW
jgi:hypothetical protein